MPVKRSPFVGLMLPELVKVIDPPLVLLICSVLVCLPGLAPLPGTLLRMFFARRAMSCSARSHRPIRTRRRSPRQAPMPQRR